MKKYCVIIGENNEEVNRQVQEALQAAGIKHTSDSKPDFFDQEVLTIVKGEYWWIGQGTCNAYLREYEILWPSYVIEHAAELDGARKPEREIEVGGKMYSESTLKNALREYVG